MRNILRLSICLLIIMGWGLAALSLHVIVTPHDVPVSLVPKEQFGFKETYVDTRAWKLDDVSAHQTFVAKLIRTGKSDILRHVIEDPTRGDVETQLSDALQRAPKKQKDPATSEPTASQRAAKALAAIFE
jgi:hypothetical protein